jgi:hypothetical protein
LTADDVRREEAEAADAVDLPFFLTRNNDEGAALLLVNARGGTGRSGWR